MGPTRRVAPQTSPTERSATERTDRGMPKWLGATLLGVAGAAALAVAGGGLGAKLSSNADEIEHLLAAAMGFILGGIGGGIGGAMLGGHLARN